jgi:site-specific DNA-methyltransferase (adenine-specific)
MSKELLGSFEINRIYQIPCLEALPSIPDKSIDMILCDLPYGTTQNKWDSVIDLESLWAQYKRVIKENGAVVLFAQTPFDKLLGASNLKMLKYEWVWQKNVATGHLNANKMPMKEHENILVFYKKPPVYNPQMEEGTPYINKRKPINDNGSNYGYIERTDTVNDGKRYPKSILKFDREIGLHPTQKPVSLCEYLIKTYTKEGEIVLDNCMGSGSTAVACVNTGRKFIGFETEAKYIEIANIRLDNL